MKEDDRREKLDFIRSMVEKPGGDQACRMALYAMGSVPVIGGIASGLGSAWSEASQGFVNRAVLDWADLTDKQLAEVVSTLRENFQKPTAASLALLLGEILGKDYAAVVLGGGRVVALLNPSSVQELEPYLSRGLVTLEPTGSTCPIGSGCTADNEVEDQKRRYGRGDVFKLWIHLNSE